MSGGADLGGQVAFVTGGGRGAGRLLAESLARSGSAVALLSRTETELVETAALVEAAGGRAITAVADARDEPAVRAAVATTEAELGPITLAVANAGTMRAIGPAWEVDPEAWWGDVEVSLRGAYVLAQTVLPGMTERGAGRFVALSSGAVLRAAVHQSAYAAAKAGVAVFAEALAAELEPHGVQAFAVTPGTLRTRMVAELHAREGGAEPRYVEPERYLALVHAIAVGRLDALSGRFLHALDDLDDLVSRRDEILARDLLALRRPRL